MLEFKIGDKVKILSTDGVDGISNHGVEIGMIGEVTGVDESGAIVEHPNFKYGWWSFYKYNLELVDG